MASSMNKAVRGEREALAEIDRLRARLAAVEAERGIWQETARRFCQNADYWRERTEAAEARLAAVEALCMRSEWAEWPFAKKALAAARGDGDRG